MQVNGHQQLTTGCDDSITGPILPYFTDLQHKSHWQVHRKPSKWASTGRLRASNQLQVPQAPFEIQHVHSRLPLKCVALGDNNTHVISFEDGRMAWTDGLPAGLDEALNRSVKNKKSIETVAMGRNTGSTAAGPREVWFLTEDTGTAYMGEACEPYLRKRWQYSVSYEHPMYERIVEGVAFAPNCGWFLFQKLKWEHDDEEFYHTDISEWDNLPDSLTYHLEEHWEEYGEYAEVRLLSVGHSGERYVEFESGAATWSGLHPTLSKVLQADKVRLEWLELGPNGTFVALFDNCTVWCGSQVLTEHLRSCLGRSNP